MNQLKEMKATYFNVLPSQYGSEYDLYANGKYVTTSQDWELGYYQMKGTKYPTFDKTKATYTREFNGEIFIDECNRIVYVDKTLGYWDKSGEFVAVPYVMATDGKFYPYQFKEGELDG